MQANKTHWASLLTVIVLGLSILLLLAASFILGISSLISLLGGDGAPAAEMISAFAFGFEIVLLLGCVWFIFQKVMDRQGADLPFEIPFAAWQLLAGIGLVVFCIIIGGVVSVTGIAWLGWLILPALTVLVIAPPIWLLFGIGSNGIEAGPRWRFFAVFGLSLTVAPAVMLLLEMVILVILIIGGVVYLTVAQPGLVEELAGIAQVVQFETDPQILLDLLAPYLYNPAVIAAALGYIAVVVPLIEELLKPLAVWLFARKIASPAQGFVLGLLSGAAFALFESLNASADGSTGWAAVVAVRAGTGILHITLTGLVGWGIVSAFKEKRIGRLVAAYFTAVLIHGLWNAAAVGMGILVLGEFIDSSNGLLMYAPALVCGLVVMGIGMFAVLVASNRKLKNPPPSIQVGEESVQ
jgi:hypothetical protein